MSNEMYSIVDGVKTDRWIHAEILGEDFDDVPVNKADWDESKHPRDKTGEFTSSAQMSALANKVAKKTGFDPKKIVVVEGPAEQFELNGETHVAAAVADPKTGTIKLFAEELKSWSPRAIEGTVAHEIMHQKFNQVIKSTGADKSVYGVPFPDKNGNMSKTYDPDMYEAMAEAGGVGEESRGYWEAYGNGDMSDERVVHETLAEMADIHHQTGKIPGATVWRDYYKAVLKAYKP